MPIHKVSSFHSEINSFFANKNSNAAMNSLMQALKGINCFLSNQKNFAHADELHIKVLSKRN